VLIWSFTYAKQKNLAAAKAALDGAGDTWTWTAIDACSKLVMSWFGGRDVYCANVFIQDLDSRFSHRVQLTSDGHRPYLEAVEGAFGADVDCATLQPRLRSSAFLCIQEGYSAFGLRQAHRKGEPDPRHINTSYIERQNLTMRMHMRRFIRLINFCRIHKTLRMTPATAAGVTRNCSKIQTGPLPDTACAGVWLAAYDCRASRSRCAGSSADPRWPIPRR
jgi:IS1 family transposase